MDMLADIRVETAEGTARVVGLTRSPVGAVLLVLEDGPDMRRSLPIGMVRGQTSSDRRWLEYIALTAGRLTVEDAT